MVPLVLGYVEFFLNLLALLLDTSLVKEVHLVPRPRFTLRTSARLSRPPYNLHTSVKSELVLLKLLNCPSKLALFAVL